MKFNNLYKKVMIIILGNFLLAIATGCFYLPNNIVTGGVTGISVVLQPIINVDSQIIINVALILAFVMGLIFLGGKFAISTIMSITVYPIMLDIVLRYFPKFTGNMLIAVLIGGVLTGIGIGLVISKGASTGGMDIPPLIINKLTGIKVSYLVFLFDTLIVLSGIMVFGWKKSLIGVISVLVCSKSINLIENLNKECI